MKLIIAEKKSVAEDIANALGTYSTSSDHFSVLDYAITWTYGHCIGIDDSEYKQKWTLEGLPIFPERFKYMVLPDKRALYKGISELLKSCDTLIVATDAGREGELIAREILLLSGYSNPQKSYRLWSSEALTKEVVLKSLKNLKPLSEYDSLYFSAKARQEADWITGINLTRFFTVKSNTLYTVGRVQTPVLKIIVERDLEIDSFVSRDYWIVKGEFKKEGITYQGKYISENADPNAEQYLTLEAAKEIVLSLSNEKKALVESVKVEQKKVGQPPLHSLTTLQMLANRVHGYSAAQTLDIAQILYERHKCISYPRSDSNHLGESSRELVLQKMQIFSPDLCDSVKSAGKRIFDDSKLTDHHALIPLAEYRGDDKKEKDIFQLILNAFLATFSGEYLYQTTQSIHKIAQASFLVSGRKDISLGWKKYYKSESDQDDILPTLVQGERVDVVKCEDSRQSTKPPVRYSEETILKQMQKYNLGTPATRAATIERLIASKFIEREKKNMISTPKGKELIRVLDDSRVTQPDFTSQMEEKLDIIYKQKKGFGGYEQVMGEIKTFVTSELNKFSEVELQQVSDRNKASKKMLDYANMIAQKKGEKKFSTKTSYEDIKKYIEDNAPKREAGQGEEKSAKKESISEISGACKKKGCIVKEFDTYYRCDCGKMVFKTIASVVLTREQIIELFAGNEILLKGCKGKTKDFDAPVVIKKSKKAEFNFKK